MLAVRGVSAPHSGSSYIVGPAPKLGTWMKDVGLQSEGGPRRTAVEPRGQTLQTHVQDAWAHTLGLPLQT